MTDSSQTKKTSESSALYNLLVRQSGFHFSLKPVVFLNFCTFFRNNLVKR